ncbi:hypothetical protein J2S11_000365 [Bacillus horti]|uniref:Uncharacterized protein n=1 Tax=Caldalkalibacillus horti TaxID=77523 RepID=A0ABT9VU06_9BACI|nr:hypothetical protein [Bacillus horti]
MIDKNVGNEVQKYTSLMTNLTNMSNQMQKYTSFSMNSSICSSNEKISVFLHFND